MVITNNPAPAKGLLLATLTNPVVGGTEVVVETVISVSQGPLSDHAQIMRLLRQDSEPVGLAIKTVEIDPNSWGLNIWISDVIGDSFYPPNKFNRPLSSEAPIFYTVSQRLLSGGTQAEVYVNDSLIGTYATNRPGSDLAFVQVGHTHGGIGFPHAVVSDVRIGGLVPEPATMTLLALGGLSLLRRRKK